MKLMLLIIMVTVFIVSFFNELMAGERYYYIPEYPPIQIELINGDGTSYEVPQIDSSGIALGIATAQHQFDFGTHRWQWSAGVGFYDGDDAFSIGAAKRFDRVLVDVTAGRGGDKTGVGVGFHGRFE